MAQHRLRVCIGHNEDGSPVTKQISAHSEIELSDKAAKALLASERRSEFVSDAIPAKPEQHKAPTFAEYAETWFRTYKQPTLKETSQACYQKSVDKLVKVFGNTPMDKITTPLLQDALNRFAVEGGRHGTGTAKSTIQKDKLTLKQIFKSAFEDGIIDKNPADTKRLKNPSEIAYERKALSDADYYDVLAHLPQLQPEDQALIGLFALTGMRRGEVLGLKWANVDFTEGLIRVRDNATYPDSRNDALLTTPKTKTSIRDLSITSRLREILEALPSSGEFVIGGQDKPISKSSYGKRWNRIKRTINLHGAAAHIFRHTYGTYLSYQDVGAVDLTAIMGHEDVSTTMKYYVHVKTDSVRNAERKAAQSIERGIEDAKRAA